MGTRLMYIKVELETINSYCGTFEITININMMIKLVDMYEWYYELFVLNMKANLWICKENMIPTQCVPHL